MLEAGSFRGPGPLTPRLADETQHDPDLARTRDALGHGDQHIRCRYRVGVNGADYAFTHVVGNTWQRYDTGRCEQVREDVAREIREATRDCTDLKAGEYDGFVFEAL